VQLIPLFLCLIFGASLAAAQPLAESSDWNAFFSKEAVKGVFVLCKSTTENCATNDIVRANTQFLPASTFKIPNSLIALETGVIKNPDQVFKWDGTPRSMKQWERDFNLRGAIQNSVVPIFQKLAVSIGEKQMQSYVHKFKYGNENIGGGLDHFWLDGALRISALQQLEFLGRLKENRLPASLYNQLVVKDALISEATPEYVIRSKTGYSLGAPGYGDRFKPGIAWWVGWIEKGTEIYYFACNIDVEKESDLPARKSVAVKILQSQGILP